MEQCPCSAYSDSVWIPCTDVMLRDTAVGATKKQHSTTCFLVLGMFLISLTTGCSLESSCCSYLGMFVFDNADTTSSVSSLLHLIKFSWQQISLINWKQCVLLWLWRSCSRRHVCQYACEVRVGHFKPSCLTGDSMYPRSLSHEKTAFLLGTRTTYI